MRYDVIIVGGGIVGVATAWQLSKKYPGKKILLLEKEASLASHQTGRNSGVLHAGVYYPPKSLKARYCRRGLNLTAQFCQQHELPIEQCGKLIVATNALEEERMAALFERARKNGLTLDKLSGEQLAEQEPAIIGLGAIKVAETGIVDFTEITEKMAQLFVEQGGEIQYGVQVKELLEESDRVRVISSQSEFEGGYLIACGGLMADKLAQMMGVGHDFQIIPYRGEYYRLAEQHNTLVNHLIYPVPDPELPFLGVHLTKMIDGYLTVGPNAVQGWKREGYGKRNISLGDSARMMKFAGFWKVMGKHWQTGVAEIYRSANKKAYLKQVNKYCPQLTVDDLKPHPVGIRAQAVLKDGSLVQDFLFAETLRSLHVCNAPSPAATSAIPIAEYLCQKVEMRRLF